jgi:hypothetical protein
VRAILGTTLASLAARLRLAVTILAGAAACGDGEVCSREAFEEAMASGHVALGACAIEGSLAITRPVTVTGVPAGARSIASRLENVEIATSGAVELRGLTIASREGAAVLARMGDLALENVVIQIERGAGVAVESGTVRLSNVEIRGTVSIDDPPELPVIVRPSDASSHGIVVSNGTATLTGVTITAMAAAGALFHASDVTWTGGMVTRNLGAGVIVEGGTARLTGVTIGDTKQGFSLTPAYGLVGVSGVVETTMLAVAGTQGVGVAQIGSTGSHVDLDTADNAVAGVWAERSAIAVTGAIHDNKFAGLVAVETTGVDLHDATIERTEKRLRQVELLGSIEVGDGVQVVRPTGVTTMRGLDLTGNERVGLLCELPAEHGTITLEDVDVSVAGDAAAAIAQGMPPPGWDDGVRRTGTDRDTDRSKSGSFATLEVIGPCDRPKESGIETGLADIGL